MRTTAQQIEARDFTYCSGYYGRAIFFKCVVGTPRRAEARERAARLMVDVMGREPQSMHVYPRRYVREARALFAAGRHD